MKPLVTVVTPVLNRAHTIELCLRSVQAQTYSRVEHIVVDGGSTDGTLEILREYERAGSLSVLTGPDDGMYDAINKGMASASGRVVAYLNSDDLYLPWSVEVALKAMEREQADLIYGELGLLSTVSGRPTFNVQFYPPSSFRFYTHTDTIGQPTVFWRKELLERIGEFDLSYRLIADCQYWLRAAAANVAFAHVQEVLAIQLDHARTLRELHPDVLEKEFARLQREFRPLSGHPHGAFRRKLESSWFRRRKQIEFFMTCRRGGNKWPRFTGWLRESGIKVPVRGFLRNLLPRYLRGPGASMIPGELFHRELLASIGIGTDGSRGPNMNDISHD